jgi:hypothetical protein
MKLNLLKKKKTHKRKSKKSAPMRRLLLREIGSIPLEHSEVS